VKEDVMGGTHSTLVRIEKCMQNFNWNRWEEEGTIKTLA
jgi:hypothetical protein